jgi:lysyl-tRNA synthetase class 2
MGDAFSEQELVRIQKLEQLRQLSINPYPAEEFKTTTKIIDILTEYKKYENKEVKIAGRLMSMRIMGGASFCEIQDFENRIQLYVQSDSICSNEDKSLYNTVFKKLLDLGDFIGVEGVVFKTKVGEISIHVTNFKLLSKALKPLPSAKDDGGKVHCAFSNTEQKYRQRYVDLILNKDSRNVFKTRIKIIQFIRDYLNNFGYYEVETPILQPLYGGAAARPFKTHHNTLDVDMYLRISNELYLKRLIIGGFEGVYEFSKDFRNEGMDRFHNPEFTQIELYVAYKDYKWMMNFVETMLQNIVKNICGGLILKNQEVEIDFSRFEKYTIMEVIKKYTGVDISGMNEVQLRDIAKKFSIKIEESSGYGKIIDEIFGAMCEPNLIQPTFITDYPIEMSPLAKQKNNDPKFVERFELFINGKECANAFSELNDPLEQKKRFQEELEMARRGDPEAMQMDNDFINAMMYGMPPTAGVGIGIDRLTMFLTGAKSIQDVSFFPQMRNGK